MARPPGKFEYDLLQFLSEHEGISVREIYDQFGKPMGYIRGTIVKAMDRLLKKGQVERETVAGTYVYRTKSQKYELQTEQIDSFIHERLGGKLGPLANYLASSETIDPEELKKLKELLNEREP